MKYKVLGSFIGRVPAGEYYFGDPCYLYQGKELDRKWSEIVDRMFVEGWTIDGTSGMADFAPTVSSVPALFVQDDIGWFVAACTRYGDGVFSVARREVGVDSGTLALISSGFTDRIKTHKLEDCFAKVKLGCDIVRVTNGDWQIKNKLFCRTSDGEDE